MDPWLRWWQRRRQNEFVPVLQEYLLNFVFGLLLLKQYLDILLLEINLLFLKNFSLLLDDALDAFEALKVRRSWADSFY
jgi:hypothetical protein